MKWILIFVIHTTSYQRPALTSITQEFHNEKACLMAARVMATDVKKFADNLSYGCFPTVQ